MLEKAKEKGIYKNYIHALLGPNPIEGVEKGLSFSILYVVANARLLWITSEFCTTGKLLRT